MGSGNLSKIVIGVVMLFFVPHPSFGMGLKKPSPGSDQAACEEAASQESEGFGSEPKWPCPEKDRDFVMTPGDHGGTFKGDSAPKDHKDGSKTYSGTMVVNNIFASNGTYSVTTGAKDGSIGLEISQGGETTKATADKDGNVTATANDGTHDWTGSGSVKENKDGSQTVSMTMKATPKEGEETPKDKCISFKINKPQGC
jgi:hypothetical protein